MKPSSPLQTTPYKLLAIVGPTASGKSELAVELAKKYNGEIISCDSRQIYKGMNIGTGKVQGKWNSPKFDGRQKRDYFVYKGIIHHCIDYIDPKKQYSVSLFQKDAQKALGQIQNRGHLPILCGGTGQWLDTIIQNKKLPEVKPQPKLRKQLEKLSVEELYSQLQKLDPDRAAVIDWHNPRRLIRALEIVLTTGKPVPKLATGNSQLVTLSLGLYPGQDELYKKIDKRLKERLKHDMVSEVKKLRASGLSWKKLESFGLEYKHIALFLQKKITEQQMQEQLSFAIKHYAKRQMTWFRKNENIVWISKPSEAKALVEKFLK